MAGGVENGDAADGHMANLPLGVEPRDFKITKNFVPFQLRPVRGPDALVHVHIRQFPARLSDGVVPLERRRMGTFPFSGNPHEAEIRVLLPEPVG